MYPEFDVTGLSKFSGRPVASYTNYAEEAIEQATLLFKKATCLASFPTNEDDAKIATKAIYQLADALSLAQPYQEALATPFSSESIGSYSYSKLVNSITRSEKTNLLWFDLAVESLGVCGFMGGASSMGGIEAFEFDNLRVPGFNGNTRLTGPAGPYGDGSPWQDPSDSGGLF